MNHNEIDETNNKTYKKWAFGLSNELLDIIMGLEAEKEKVAAVEKEKALT